MKYQKVIETNKKLMPKGEKSGDISYDHQRLEQLDDLRSIKKLLIYFRIHRLRWQCIQRS